MKKDIHPKYGKTVIKCACGNEIETKSTAGEEVHVELCSACHPFFTGKQKFVDTAGRVDKFRARVEKAQEVKSKKLKVKNEAPKEKPSNQDKLSEIKEELIRPVEIQETHKDAPGEITQGQSSDEELAAKEELKEN